MSYKNIASRFFGLVTNHACDRRSDRRMNISMLLRYLGKLKNYKFCTFRARKTLLLSSSNRYLSNVMKISAKINTMKNINILLFCLFTVLNKLKALQLSKIGLWSDF